MSTAIEGTGFIMCIISWLVTGTALANDYWKISSVSGSVIVSQRLFENLWHSCAENSAGIAECRDFESMLGLPGKKTIVLFLESSVPFQSFLFGPQEVKPSARGS